MAQHCLHGRHTVGGKFHHKGRIVALDEETAQQPAHHHGHQDADDIEGNHNHGLILDGKEGTDNHDVDGQSGRATHKREDEHGDEP